MTAFFSNMTIQISALLSKGEGEGEDGGTFYVHVRGLSGKYGIARVSVPGRVWSSRWRIPVQGWA